MHEVEGIEEERKVHHSVSRKICDVMGLRGRAVRRPQGHHSDIWKYKKNIKMIDIKIRTINKMDG